MRCLNSHPDIEARQEDLRRKQDRTYEFLNELYSTKKNFGTKIMYDHINEEVRKFLINMDIKIIQLIRRDMLETVIWRPENLIAGALECGYGPPLKLKSDRYRVDITKVITDLRNLQEDIQRYKAIADMVIFYEDDLTCKKDATRFENPITRNKLLNFIGVSDCELMDKQRKNARPPSKEIIENYGLLLKTVENYNGYITTYYD